MDIGIIEGQEPTLAPEACEMRIMGKPGDTKVIWDPSRPAEVDAARKQFNELRRKGYVAFKGKKDGSKGKKITEFDPKAQRMIMVPPMRGG